MSIDGYIDDASDKRLILSNEEDFDRVDEVRASCDAILVGAQTIRKDNPRLLVRSEKRRKERLSKGMSESPVKVTITNSGNFSSEYSFFQTGKTDKIVFCNSESANELKSKLSGLAEIVEYPASLVDLKFVLEYLYKKGIRSLLVEGGSFILTSFLENNLANELQISIAPFFVGEANAPRFVGQGKFKYNKDKRMVLKKLEKIGDMAVLTYTFP